MLLPVQLSKESSCLKNNRRFTNEAKEKGGKERERKKRGRNENKYVKKKKILRKEIKGSSMQPTRSVGGIPSGDWMTEFPRRHSVVRRLNGFMEGLVRGELARIQKRASGGRLEMREILIKRRRTRLTQG